MIAHGEKYPGGALAATRSLVQEGGVRIFARGCESRSFLYISRARALTRSGAWLTEDLTDPLTIGGFVCTDPAVLVRSFPVNALLLPVADVLRGFFERVLPDSD